MSSRRQHPKFNDLPGMYEDAFRDLSRSGRTSLAPANPNHARLQATTAGMADAPTRFTPLYPSPFLLSSAMTTPALFRGERPVGHAPHGGLPKTQAAYADGQFEDAEEEELPSATTDGGGQFDDAEEDEVATTPTVPRATTASVDAASMDKDVASEDVASEGVASANAASTAVVASSMATTEKGGSLSANTERSMRPSPSGVADLDHALADARLPSEAPKHAGNPNLAGGEKASTASVQTGVDSAPSGMKCSVAEATKNIDALVVDAISSGGELDDSPAFALSVVLDARAKAKRGRSGEAVTSESKARRAGRSRKACGSQANAKSAGSSGEAVTRQSILTRKKEAKGTNGFWTQAEEEQFKQGLIVHGWSKWKSIANSIPTRTNKQVKAHAQGFERWHPQEKERLLDAHKARRAKHSSKKAGREKSGTGRGTPKAVVESLSNESQTGAMKGTVSNASKEKEASTHTHSEGHELKRVTVEQAKGETAAAKGTVSNASKVASKPPSAPGTVPVAGAKTATDTEDEAKAKVKAPSVSREASEPAPKDVASKPEVVDLLSDGEETSEEKGSPVPEGRKHRQFKKAAKGTTGFWTQTEEKQFERGVVLYGWGNWKAISGHVPTRERNQCKSHAQKIQRDHPREMERLKAAHRAHKARGAKQASKKAGRGKGKAKRGTGNATPKAVAESLSDESKHAKEATRSDAGATKGTVSNASKVASKPPSAPGSVAVAVAGAKAAEASVESDEEENATNWSAIGTLRDMYATDSEDEDEAKVMEVKAPSVSSEETAKGTVSNASKVASKPAPMPEHATKVASKAYDDEDIAKGAVPNASKLASKPASKPEMVDLLDSDSDDEETTKEKESPAPKDEDDMIEILDSDSDSDSGAPQKKSSSQKKRPARKAGKKRKRSNPRKEPKEEEDEEWRPGMSTDTRNMGRGASYGSLYYAGIPSQFY